MAKGKSKDREPGKATKLTTEELQERCKELSSEFTRYEQAQTPHRNKWLKYYRYYHAYLTKDYNYSQKRIIPIAFNTIMAILPRLVTNKPQLQYIMRHLPEGIEHYLQGIDSKLSAMMAEYEQVTKEDVDRIPFPIDKDVLLERYRGFTVSLMDYVVQWQMKKMRFNSKLAEMLLIGLIYGTHILHVGWRGKNNAPYIEPLEPFNFFPDPGCHEIDNLGQCMTRTWLPLKKVQELFDGGTYHIPLPDDVELETLISDNTDWNEKMTIQELYAGGNNNKEIQVIEYFSDDEIVTMIGANTGQHIVRNIVNPYKKIPFIIGYNYFCPGSFWGMSEIEMLEQFIEDATDIRAIRMSNIDVMTNLMWLADSTKEIFYEDLIAAPNQIIRAEGGKDALTPIHPPPISEGSYREEEICNKYVQEISGIADYMRGNLPNRMETATSVNTLTNTANMRFALKLETLAEYVLVPLGEFFIDLNKLFLEPMTLRINEKDYDGGFVSFELDTELLKALDTDYDIETMPGDYRLTEKNNIIQLAQIIGGNESFMKDIKNRSFLSVIMKMFDMPIFDMFKTSADKAREQKAEEREQKRQAAMQPTPQPQQQAPGGLPSQPLGMAPPDLNTLPPEIQNDPAALAQILQQAGGQV